MRIFFGKQRGQAITPVTPDRLVLVREKWEPVTLDYAELGRRSLELTQDEHYGPGTISSGSTKRLEVEPSSRPAVSNFHWLKALTTWRFSASSDVVRTLMSRG